MKTNPRVLRSISDSVERYNWINEVFDAFSIKLDEKDIETLAINLSGYTQLELQKYLIQKILSIPSIPNAALLDFLPKSLYTYECFGREKLKKEILELFKIIEKSELQKHYDIEIPKGLLFTGRNGSGKTSICHWIIQHFTPKGWRTFELNIPGTKSKYVGESERIIRDTFYKARSCHAPSFILIENIESFGRQRKQDNSNDHSLVYTLLTEMDGVSAMSLKNPVILLCTTRKPEALDAALTRPGRLNHLFHLEYPDEKEKQLLIDGWNSKYGKLIDSKSLINEPCETLADLKSLYFE